MTQKASGTIKDKVILPKLSIGQLVRVQDEKSGQWQALATVVEVRPDGLSYIVDICGREQLRSHPMLSLNRFLPPERMKMKGMGHFLRVKGMGKKWELFLHLFLL